MEFKLGKQRNKINISLIYREKEHSFDVETAPENSFSSILVNDLHLEIDEDNQVIYVWGLCPLSSCQVTEKYPQNYLSGSLILTTNEKLIPGVSYRINANRWLVHMNKTNGWICIGDPCFEKRILIEFASNCIAVLEERELKAIWLRPRHYEKG